MKKTKGFHCPTCAVALKTHKTIPRAAGIISRRRRCPRCDFRLTTTERPETHTPAR
jgi:transcriptional regulator NrdR family protein